MYICACECVEEVRVCAFKRVACACAYERACVQECLILKKISERK